ncbi:hypothetical protein MFIFM68171_02002 [Madurella fahalii]|uniref:Uncharacterized protein n=1 Tax=Madurella fahalii TaxID=1157608 RepID=A0ABQ0G225_9PEZI
MSFIQRFLPRALSALYVLGKNSMTNGSVAAGSVAAGSVIAGSGKPQAQRAAETKKWRMLPTNPRIKVMAIVEGSDLDNWTVLRRVELAKSSVLSDLGI